MVLAPAANFRGKTKHQEATFPDVREKQREREMLVMRKLNS